MNFRGRRFEVDKVLDRAALISGVPWAIASSCRNAVVFVKMRT